MTFLVVFSFLLLTTLSAQSVLAAEAPSQNPGNTASSGGTANEGELAQILGPIALYPDTLLAQMFMASTYPLEIVEAARFVKEKPSLKDDGLDTALKEKEWDVSVKSICHFPTVLDSMSQNLDATKRLGDYFLDDQKAVMDMVQTLRAKANKAGKLETSKEQKVTVEEKIIVIESTNPEVVYVPSYSCSYVYGGWGYPYYPPYVWYPPPPRYGLGVGIIIGAGIGHWCHPRWRHGDIDININRTRNFNKNINVGGGGKGQAWKHNPKHRKGVAYNNKGARGKFGQSNRAAKQRNISRGRTGHGLDRKTRDSINRQGLKSNNRQPRKRSANQRASRPSSGNRQNSYSRRSSARSSRSSQRSNAFRSSGSGNRASRSSHRGSMSRGGRSRGGGHRGGGRRR